MRSYPVNSPRAAARLVALTVLADGCPSRSELDALSTYGVLTRLGVSTDEWQELTRALCEDCLSLCGPTWRGLGDFDPATLDALLAEIDEPGLSRNVLDLCTAVALADGRIQDEEWRLLRLAARRWRIGDMQTAWCTVPNLDLNR